MWVFTEYKVRLFLPLHKRSQRLYSQSTTCSEDVQFNYNTELKTILLSTCMYCHGRYDAWNAGMQLCHSKDVKNRICEQWLIQLYFINKTQHDTKSY